MRFSITETTSIAPAMAEGAGGSQPYEAGNLLDRLTDETMELASQISRMDPFALRQAKRAVNQTLDIQGFYAAIQSVFDIHQTGHGNALSVGGYPIITRLAEMKERIKSQ